MALQAVVDVLGAMAAAESPAELDAIGAKPRLTAFRNSNPTARRATLVDLMQSILVPLRTELNTTHGLDDTKLAKLSGPVCSSIGSTSDRAIASTSARTATTTW